MNTNILLKSKQIFIPLMILMLIDLSNEVISQPLVLELNIGILQRLSSLEASDGILKANPSGGTKSYTFIWSENAGNQIKQIIKNVSQGIYRSDMNDSNTCGLVLATIFLMRTVIKGGHLIFNN